MGSTSCMGYNAFIKLIDYLKNAELNTKGLENIDIGEWKTGGWDCNLHRLGTMGTGELDWEMRDPQLFDPVVAEATGSLLADLIKK